MYVFAYVCICAGILPGLVTVALFLPFVLSFFCLLSLSFFLSFILSVLLSHTNQVW